MKRYKPPLMKRFAMPEWLDRVNAVFQAGGTIPEAAKEAGISVATLNRWHVAMEQRGIAFVRPIRSRRSPVRLVRGSIPHRIRRPPWIDEATKVLQAGGTIAEAAQAAGVHRNNVFRYLRNAEAKGVPVVRSVRTRRPTLANVR